jgi:thioredoxin-like negative regulator of GroEL
MNIYPGKKMSRCFLCGAESPFYRDKDTERTYCPFCQFPIGGDKAVALDDTNLEKYIEISRSRMIILFYAPWDYASHDFIAMFDSCVALTANRVVLISIDTTKNPEVTRKFGINILPTIIVIEYGKEANRVLGTISRYELERLIVNGKI